MIVGILSAMTAYGFIYISFNELIAGLGIAGLVIASLLNVDSDSRRINQNESMASGSLARRFSSPQARGRSFRALKVCTTCLT